MFTKLFDLIPIIEKIDSHFGHDNCSVESIEGSGNNLFIGTSLGGVISFSITESTTETGKTEAHSVEWAKAILTQGRPVSQMKSASALNRLFALVDGSLHILTMQDLQNVVSPKNRSISCFALNECPNNDNPFLIELAFGTRRRQIIVCDFSNDKLTAKIEIETDDIPISLAYDERYICYATSVHYYILHLNNKSTKPLFPINSEQMVPIVKRIAKNEFILNGLENLGVFATSEGASNRPPLFWSAESVKSLSFSFPYVISLGDQFISVHSLLDQQLKQQLPYTGGRFLNEIEGQVFVVSRKNIYRLNPVSWEKQVDSLLNDNLVDEALTLAQTARKPGTSKEDFVKIFKKFQQKAGFIKLNECKFEEAFELFSQGKVDIREVLCLFPRLLPISSNYVRSVPPLHNIPDIEFVVKKNSELRTQCKKFLLKFLLAVRSKSWTKVFIPEIDLAILKLYAEYDSKMLSESLMNTNSLTDMNDFEQWCRENNCINAQALVLWKQDRKREALNIWMKLIDNEISDSSFSGLDWVFDLLAETNSFKQIHDNLPWFLQRDMNTTLKILSRSSESTFEEMSSTLKNNPQALRVYLEHLVFEQDNQQEKVHTNLAELYLSSIGPNTDDNDEIRKSFRQFLYSSNLYRVHYLMSKIEDSSNMVYEKAILLGKLSEHSKAFEILIDQLKNYHAAEEYCSNLSKHQTREQRHSMYSILLQTYLSHERGDHFVVPVLHLLNSKNLDVDFKEVMQMLPSHWSLSVLAPFLRQSSLKHRELVDNEKLKLYLAKSLKDTLDFNRCSSSDRSYCIAETDRCSLCQNTFADSVCVIYPDGSMVHKNCVKHKYLSPSTQTYMASLNEK